VFLLNSRLILFTAASIAGGTPYPEVTELYCLVPERAITRAPENTLLVHMCLFVVRVPQFSLEDFPGRRPGGFACPDLVSPWIETIAHQGLHAASPLRSLSNQGSHGMLTVCPSATPFGLALGPD
jgi:hypothetical protein